MRIGLIDVDGHRFPNIPLMKISAYHKKQGNSVQWYEPLFHSMEEPFDIVYMSKVFSFTPDFQYHVNCKNLVRGGSGYAITLVDGKEVYNKSKDKDLPDEIEHMYPDYSLYPELTKDTAYGFLTRGCPRGCGFCHVSDKEGARSRKVANLSEFWNGQKNIVLCDPNILACPDHIDLLKQLINSRSKIEFNQGLDIRLVNEDNLELLRQIRINKPHFAFDDYKQKNIIMPKMKMVREITGWNRRNTRPVVLILCNYDTTLEQDIERIQFCRSLEWSPYPMIYDKEHADPIYRKLQRWCNNFIFWNCKTFKEYNGKIRKG